MGSKLKFIFKENFHAISILTGRKTKEKTQQKENQQKENFIVYRKFLLTDKKIERKQGKRKTNRKTKIMGSI